MLEDNFNGTYDCHFKIPFGKLLRMEKYIDIPGGGRNSPMAGSRFQEIATAIFAAIGGLMLIPTGKNARKQRTEFLKVRYTDANGQPDEIFFKNCDALGGMIKAFEKQKN